MLTLKDAVSHSSISVSIGRFNSTPKECPKTTWQRGWSECGGGFLTESDVRAAPSSDSRRKKLLLLLPQWFARAMRAMRDMAMRGGEEVPLFRDPRWMAQWFFVLAAETKGKGLNIYVHGHGRFACKEHHLIAGSLVGFLGIKNK